MTRSASDAPPRDDPPHVAILMAVLDGARWLPDQLESIAAQSHSDWRLIVGDDGSSDGSLELVSDFLSIYPGHCQNGPGQGSAANFLSLLRAAPDHMPDDSWLAFSDQDDVWMPERLARGIAALQSVPTRIPALYCSRTWIVDEELQNRRISAPRPRKPGFHNALVQNIAAGNTVLLNPAGARLLCAASHDIGSFVVHDWWAYQVITGVGGQVVHDNTPTLLYRQHEHNSIGANRGRVAGFARVASLLRGELRGWNRVNLAALSASAHRLTPQSQESIEFFRAIHYGGLHARLLNLLRLKPYRQTGLETAAIWLSGILRRL